MNPLDRVWADAAPDPRAALERTLPPTDLRTLLLGVSHARASAVTPAGVVRQWRDDRFVRPSGADPKALVRVAARLWEALPESFAGIALSPVAPLGTCSAVATVDQNRVVSTARGTEVVSDPTNALAVEAAVRRRSGAARVDLAVCHRVLRAQAMDGPGVSAHFELFALVSSARDAGSGRTETALLGDHVRYWAAALGGLGVRARFGITGYGDATLLTRLRDGGLPVEDDADRTHGTGYYSAALGITAGGVNLGDGGVVPWTAALMGDAKERCVISCVATERLVGVL